MLSAPLFTQLLTPPAINGASLVAQIVKNLPAMWETQVWSLGWEDSLEKGMAIHLSILAWKIQWTEEPGGLQSMGSQRVGHYRTTFTYSLARSLTHSLTLLPSTSPPEWCIHYNQWTYISSSPSSRVHSLHWGSLMVLYILWVWKIVQ